MVRSTEEYASKKIYVWVAILRTTVFPTKQLALLNTVGAAVVAQDNDVNAEQE